MKGKIYNILMRNLFVDDQPGPLEPLVALTQLDLLCPLPSHMSLCQHI